MTKTEKIYDFNTEDYIVYPAHGVGQIVSIDKHEVAGMEIEMFVISFDKDKMTLRIPTEKATAIGLRSVASRDTVGKAMETLKFLLKDNHSPFHITSEVPLDAVLARPMVNLPMDLWEKVIWW